MALCASHNAELPFWESAFAGRLGISWLWNFLYAIGSRVISDDIYGRLYDAVIHSGAAVGGLFAMVIVLLLRRPAPGVLVSGHGLAITVGFLGGCFGWQQGLWAYFGALVVFTIGVAFRGLFRPLQLKLREHI
jgi:hypothetical protein